MRNNLKIRRFKIFLALSTSLVMQHFPTSKWNKKHYAWYKSKIKNGEISVPGFVIDGDTDLTEDEVENEVEESIDASVSLEKDLHTYLASRVEQIELGLNLVEDGVEYQTEAGRIDLIAQDKDGKVVVIELKAGKARDNALGQLLGYMGCISVSGKFNGKEVRGILIASHFEQRVIYAARGLSNVKLVKYQLLFDLQEIT